MWLLDIYRGPSQVDCIKQEVLDVYRGSSQGNCIKPEVITCDSLLYTGDHLKLIVSNQK